MELRSKLSDSATYDIAWSLPYVMGLNHAVSTSQLHFLTTISLASHPFLMQGCQRLCWALPWKGMSAKCLSQLLQAGINEMVETGFSANGHNFDPGTHHYEASTSNGAMVCLLKSRK
jgi:hypothetical protein